MSNKLESKIRQILRDIRFPTQDIRYEFCDALTFASDEADFFMRANQFLYTLQNNELNCEFYDKAKACFGAEVIDLYFDTSLIGNEWIDDSISQFHAPSVVSQANNISNMPTINEQLDLFAQPVQLESEAVVTGAVSNNTSVECGCDNGQSSTDTPDMTFNEVANVEDLSQEIVKNDQIDDTINVNTKETDDFSVVSDDNPHQQIISHVVDWQNPLTNDLENNNKNHGKTSFYEEDEDEKNSQHNPSFSELEPNDVSDFEDNYNNDDDYGIECDYSHNDYEVNEDYPKDQYYNDDESGERYEEELDLEETLFNIYDIEELESANAEINDLEIPDITFSDDILEAMLDKVTTQTRIIQEVVKFVQKNDLDYNEYKSLLENIFFHLGWNGAKRAVQRLFDEHTTLSVDTLRAVFELKLAWEEHDAFWAIRHRNGSFENTYAVLSWPIAHAIIDSYSYVPDIEEVIGLLYEKFYQWRNSPILPKAFPCFMKYIWSQFFGVKGLLPETYHQDFRVNEFTPEIWQDTYDLLDNQITEALVDYGVRFSEPFPSMDYWTLEKTHARFIELNEKPNKFITINEGDDE